MADDILRADKRLGANKRERALNPSEVAALVKWMPQNYTRTVSDALALTLLTGCRSGEVVAWEWKHYDSEDGTMFQPETKSGTAFTVALSRQAMAILEARREIAKGSDFVFPGRAGRVQQKVVGVEVYAHSGESKASVYKGKAACPVKNWTPHDLRRTARTLLQALGCPFDVGEEVLNHALPSMGETYARDPMIEPRRHWLQKLADHIDALTVDNVVPMKPTKRKA